MLEEGTIVVDYGHKYLVRSNSNSSVYLAVGRGKKKLYVCGDIVLFKIINYEQAVIEKLKLRKTILYRQDKYRSKLIASNVTQILYVVAPIPFINDNLLQRVILAAESQEIVLSIIINKIDLDENLLADLVLKLEKYYAMGYQLVKVSAIDNIDSLIYIMKNHNNIFVGQSGVGKSSLLNKIFNKNLNKEGFISINNRGKHTTTNSSLYYIDNKTSIIDSPGLQLFGLNYLDPCSLLNYFPDMNKYLGRCKYNNCFHLLEPGCVIKEMGERGLIDKSRIDFLNEITKELLNTKQK